MFEKVVHIHVHVADDEELRRIGRKIDQMLQLQGEVMTDLSVLDAAVANAEAAVAENTTVVGSASTLLDQLAEMLRANATDPEAIQALADRLSSSSAAETSNNQALADAITRNTPAA